MATKPAKECLECHSATRNSKARFCWNCAKPYDRQNLKNLLIYQKEKILGGIVMYANRIVTGILLIIALAALVIFFPILPLVFGVWGIVALIASVALVIGLIAALVFFFFPLLLIFRWVRNIGLGVGVAMLVFALIIGFTLPLTRGIMSPTTTAQTTLSTTTPTTIASTTTTTATETPAATTATESTTATLAVVDPALEHGTYPQVQIGHPNFYVETGTNATYRWTFEVKDQEIGIVGGLVVDGKSGGVYRAYGPGKYTVTVQNGFVLTTQKEWAQNEFMFRVGQAVQYNWAYGTIDYGPLTPPSK